MLWNWILCFWKVTTSHTQRARRSKWNEMRRHSWVQLKYLTVKSNFLSLDVSTLPTILQCVFLQIQAVKCQQQKAEGENCHWDNYLHELLLRSLCCRVSLISLDASKLRTLEMNWDKVMRGYRYRGRSHRCTKFSLNNGCIYHADLIYWWPEGTQIGGNKCTESKWDWQHFKSVTIISRLMNLILNPSSGYKQLSCLMVQ